MWLINVFSVWTGRYIAKGFVDLNSKGSKNKLKTQKNPKTNFKSKPNLNKESGKNRSKLSQNKD